MLDSADVPNKICLLHRKYSLLHSLISFGGLCGKLARCDRYSIGIGQSFLQVFVQTGNDENGRIISRVNN